MVNKYYVLILKKKVKIFKTPKKNINLVYSFLMLFMQFKAK